MNYIKNSAAVIMIIIIFSCQQAKITQDDNANIIIDVAEQEEHNKPYPFDVSINKLCGNGVIDQDENGYFEECDDGNRINGDGCNDLCRWECGYWHLYVETLAAISDDKSRHEILLRDQNSYLYFCPYLDVGSQGALEPSKRSHEHQGICSEDLVPIKDQTSLSGWRSPDILSDVSKGVSSIDGAVLDVNALNNAVAIWHIDTPNYIAVSSYFYGSGFTPQLIISSLELNEEDKPKYTAQGDPHIALNNNNYAVAVWEGFVFDDNTATDYDVIISATRDQNGLWSPVVTIGPNADELDRENPIVAVNDNGLAVAIWHERDTVLGYVKIMASFLPFAGAWSTPYMIQGNIQRFREDSPDVKIDASGNVVVVWKNKDVVGIDSLYAASYDQSIASWSLPILLDQALDFTLPKVAIDINYGNAVAVWARNNNTLYEMMAASFIKGIGWAKPVLLDTTTNGSINHPHVVRDRFGYTTAVWDKQENTISQIYASSLSLRGIWSPPGLLSTSGSYNVINVGLDQRPLSVDSQGVVRLIYNAINNNDSVIKSVTKIGQSWQDPETIFSPDTSTFTHNIGGGVCGFAIALWGLLTPAPFGFNEVQASIHDNNLAPFMLNEVSSCLSPDHAENCNEILGCCRNIAICDAICEEFCGDGIWDRDASDGYFEACDDGNNIIFDGCTPQCQLNGCGDGYIYANEQCDDGNNINGDNCSSSCLFIATTSTGNPIPLVDASGNDPTPGVVSDTKTNILLSPYCEDGLPISDIQFVMDIDHNFVGDLIITLTYGNSMIDTEIINQPLSSSALNGVYSFHDAYVDFIPNAFSPPFANPIPNGLYLPVEYLSVFIGLPATSIWKLTITDVSVGDSGTLNGWDVLIQCNPEFSP